MLTTALILGSLALTAFVRFLRGRALRASDGVLAVVSGVSVAGALLVSDAESGRAGAALARAVFFLGPALAALYGIASDRAEIRKAGLDARGRTA